MADGIPLISQSHSDFMPQSSPFFKRTSKSQRFFKGDSDLRSCSPVTRDYIDTSVPRYHNVSPHASLTYERHHRIKNCESPKPCEIKSNTECAETSFFRKKRERPLGETSFKNEATEPTSGGRWMLSALRRLPLVGSLVSSQDDQYTEKESQTVAKYTRELTEDLNFTLPSTSPVNLSCDVVASPSFKCLAEKSGDLHKNTFSTASYKDNFTVPLPYEIHSNMFHYDAPEPASKTRLQQKWDKSPLYTKTSEPTDDLKSVLILRRQYGLGDILLDSCEKPSEDIVQYKRPRLSSPILSCPSDLKPSGFGSLTARSWNPCSPKLSVSKSEGTLFHWKNEDNSPTKGIVGQSNETTERLSIRSFKKKRGLRAVDYRRLLQQAKFQPCHWIDYFDYMKAKSADDQDKQHYVVNKKPFTFETDSQPETKTLPLQQNLKWSTDDQSKLLKNAFSSCLENDLKECIPSHDKTLPLNVVKSSKDIKSNTKEPTSLPILHDSFNTAAKKTKNDSGSFPTPESPIVPQDTLGTSDKFNADTTNLCHSKETKTESNPILFGTSLLKKTEQVTSPETSRVASTPWWKSNLNKTIQVDVEGDGVFAENADDNDDTVQCAVSLPSVPLGQTSSDQVVSVGQASSEQTVSAGHALNEQQGVVHDSSSDQNLVLDDTSSNCAVVPPKETTQKTTSQPSVWNLSTPFVFGKESAKEEQPTSFFSNYKPDSLDFKNSKDTRTIQPFSLQVPSPEKNALSFSFEAPGNKAFKKPCVSQTTSTEFLNTSAKPNSLFQTTHETETQQVNAFPLRGDAPQTSSFLNPLPTSSLPFVSNNAGFNTTTTATTTTPTTTKTSTIEKPSLFFNGLSTSTSTNTLLGEAATSQSVSSSFLQAEPPLGTSSIQNPTLQESVSTDSQPTPSNSTSLFKLQETASLFNAPLTLNTPVSPFRAASSVEQPKTSLFSLSPSSTSFFGNTSTNVADKPFSTSPLHTTQQTTSNDSTAPGIQKNFSFSSGLFGNQQSNTSCFNLPTAPSTLKSDSTDSMLNITSPSLFNSLSASTAENTSVVPKPFETPQVPLFSFGGTTPTTDPLNVMSMNSTTSPNPFAANAGTFASLTPRRPKLRLKRTLR